MSCSTRRKIDALPDHILYDIFARLSNSDKKALTLSCKRFLKLGNEVTRNLKIGFGLNPVNEALASLCQRFLNLETLEMCFWGLDWMPFFKKQLDDEGLLIISCNCPFLLKLTLEYCAFITDAGLSNLASCSKLSALKLVGAPKITGRGILSIVIGCKSLSSFHLSGCKNVGSDEWLESLCKLEQLEVLSVKNCSAIGEGHLGKLGTCWSKLMRVQFENLKLYGTTTLRDQLLKQHMVCENLVELSLVDCIVNSDGGLSFALPVCPNLEKIHLDMCVHIRDSDIIAMAQSSRNLLSLYVRVPVEFDVPYERTNRFPLTDESLLVVAQNCPRLESVSISSGENDFSISTLGILALIKNCPIRELSFWQYPFDDSVLEALCSAEWLESLELVRCRKISDKGIHCLAKYPKLSVVRLIQCRRVTDEGMKTLVGSHKLASLHVECCHRLSENGVRGAAKTVTLSQQLSKMY